jgi:hypothetical protein
VEDVIRQALLQVPSVAAAYTRTQLLSPAPLDAFGEAMRLSYHPPRSPEVMYVLKPYFINRASPGTTHGSPHAYDTHVPLVWFGAGIKAGTRTERVGVDDLAPTLAKLLGLPAPSQSGGRARF